jgi:hypothetical protein
VAVSFELLCLLFGLLVLALELLLLLLLLLLLVVSRPTTSPQ